MEEIFEKVRDIIAEQLGMDEDEITMDSAFVDDLGADSLDVVDLIMAFEDAFELEIDEDDAEGIRTVGDVVNYLKDIL